MYFIILASNFLFLKADYYSLKTHNKSAFVNLRPCVKQDNTNLQLQK